jgi:hypothetical protein
MHSLQVGADFGMSQFWYTHETSCGLLQEALAHLGGGEGVVAVLSAPSVMTAAEKYEGGVHQSKVSESEVGGFGFWVDVCGVVHWNG